MITKRILTAALAGVFVLSLTACSEETPATTAQPTATAAAPEATVEATTPPPAAALSDKEICEAANKASESMKDAMTTIFQTTGDISAKDSAAILADMAKQLDKAATGSDTEVGKAVQLIASQATEAAAAKDPTAALDTAESEKSGKALNAACKKAGVTTKY
ncbi:hypothetical protein Q0Z83_012730 [Actinoplanes sichuanensis]|uniref:Lipoprotein n=1 Tax=Actinoplanes sichuanensis TaxID=512349 RepID=A0ABW4A4Y0_9ACTN|nr:hypothetical protein [Actinoplanes sichuanensis]BEL03082.1 hypothetical protein Q0Z83_012730 [Actinoplanes sichuanensis]